MTSLDTDKVVAATSALSGLLTALPQSERRDKALYHLDRLQKALIASHQEAVRFAGFTVNKTVHDSPDWGPKVAEAMEALRVSLAQSGHDFLKGNGRSGGRALARRGPSGDQPSAFFSNAIWPA